jgi:hypothetical protein
LDENSVMSGYHLPPTETRDGIKSAPDRASLLVRRIAQGATRKPTMITTAPWVNDRVRVTGTRPELTDDSVSDHLFEVILGRIDASLGAGLILIGGVLR